MSLNLTTLKAQIGAGWEELRAAELPDQDAMPFLVYARWRAVESQIDQFRNAVAELIATAARGRQGKQSGQSGGSVGA